MMLTLYNTPGNHVNFLLYDNLKIVIIKWQQYSSMDTCRIHNCIL